MKTADANAALQKLLASKDLEDHDVRVGAFKALQDMPQGLEPRLVAQAYERFARHARWDLWRFAHQFRDEHAAGLVAAARKSQPDLERSFVLAALPAKERRGALSPKAIDLLRRATRTLAKLRTLSRSAADRAGAEKMRFVADDAELVAALRAALAERGKKAPDDLLVWLWFVSILAMEGSAASAKALAPYVDEATGKDPRKNLDVLLRLIADFERDSREMGKLASRLRQSKAARDGASPATAWAKAVGITPGNWSVSVYVGTQNAPFYPWSQSYPQAMLCIECTRDPCFEVAITRKSGESEIRFDADGPGWNPLELKSPASLVEIKSWLDGVAARKLKTAWAWPHAHVSTHGLRGKEKQRVVTWATT